MSARKSAAKGETRFSRYIASVKYAKHFMKSAEA